MKKVILADGTVIENCTDSTTTNEICALRANYAEAGAVRDSFNADNAVAIEVQDESGQVIIKAGDLVLLDGATLEKQNDGVVCKVQTRVKSDVEKMQDEIAELQEAIIE